MTLTMMMAMINLTTNNVGADGDDVDERGQNEGHDSDNFSSASIRVTGYDVGHDHDDEIDNSVLLKSLSVSRGLSLLMRIVIPHSTQQWDALAIHDVVLQCDCIGRAGGVQAE